MSSSVHVIKLRSEAKDSGLFAKVTWLDKDIHLVILDNNRAWSCSIEDSELDVLGKKLRLDSIRDWAKEAFTQSSTAHQFSVGKEGLTWKKTGDTEESKMKLRIGVFPVTELNYSDAPQDILESALEAVEDSKKSYEDLSERHNTLMSHLKECKAQLEEFKKAKLDLEGEMYEQFLPILQSKQDQIKDLTRRLAKRGGGVGDTQDQDENEKVDSYGSDTDVDEDTPSKRARKSSGNDEASSSRASLDDSQNFLKL